MANASKPSVAASTPGALSRPLDMPSVFNAPAEPIRARALAPYLVFAHPNRSDEWNRLCADHGKIDEHDLFLIEQTQTTRMLPSKVGWLCGWQFWAEGNASGEVLRTSATEMPWPWQERIDAALLVYFEDRIVPANIEFRTVKCPGAKILADALEDASGRHKPNSKPWHERSPAHKESLACNQPWMRFFGVLDLGPTRIGKKSGRPYRPTTCSIHPTTLPEWRLLKDFCEAPTTKAQLEAAANFYQLRVGDMKAKLIKA